MKKMILWIAGLALLIVVAVIAYNALKEKVSPDDSIPPVSASDKQAAPDFTMIDWDGNSVKLSDMKGKPVVLNFWASWCPPCKSEMPDFETVYKELGGDVQFMMVDLTDGQRETKEIGAAYIESQGYTFPVYFDTLQEGSYAYNIRSIPTTVFIDKDGNIVKEVTGAMSETALRNGIDLVIRQ